jgi:RNA polymerase sigma-70 factor (ECF subfamily)
MKELMAEQDSIQKLVERAKAGERIAFDGLTVRYQDRLLRRIKIQLQGSPYAQVDPEEVLQETLYQALRSLDRFEWQGEGSFYFWLSGISKNVIRDKVKKTTRSSQMPAPEQVPAKDVSPSKVMRRDERFERLEAALGALPPEYEEVLRLARIDGLKIKDIAVRMKRSEYAVKHLLARAIRQLRDSFGETESLHLVNRVLKSRDHTDGQE